MTEEDTDDRMERANRIREMREGRRTTPENGDDEDASEATADGGETEAEVETDASDDDATTESAPTEDEPDDPDGSEPGTDGTAAEETPVEDDGADGSTPTIDDTVDPDDESPADDTRAPSTPDVDDGDEADRTADDGGAETSGFEFDGPAEADADGERSNGATADEEGAASEAGERAAAESGVAASVSDSEAAEAVDALSGSGAFTIPDQATTVTEDDDQSMLNAEGTVAAARAAAAGRRAAHAGDRTRVLEFDLGDERFCLDIEYIEEIVELENMTRVPNSPSYVEGVVDLRGQVTAIINPKDALAVDDDGRGDLIVVFDSEEMDEQGHLGWVVDEVRQVTPVTDEEVNESPDEDDEHINGVINREDEDEFIVWTTPELALNSTS